MKERKYKVHEEVARRTHRCISRAKFYKKNRRGEFAKANCCLHQATNKIIYFVSFYFLHFLSRLGRETDAISEATPMVVKGFVTQNGRTQEDGQIVAISAGDSHCLCLTQNGNVYQCGLYKDSDSGTFHDIPVRGADPQGMNTKPVHVWQLASNVVQIYSGGGFNAAMLSDHSIVTWGKSHCIASRHVASAAGLLLLIPKSFFTNVTHTTLLHGLRSIFLGPTALFYYYYYFRIWLLRRACSKRGHDSSQ